MAATDVKPGAPEGQGGAEAEQMCVAGPLRGSERVWEKGGGAQTGRGEDSGGANGGGEMIYFCAGAREEISNAMPVYGMTDTRQRSTAGFGQVDGARKCCEQRFW